jgi:hypothetical protein
MGQGEGGEVTQTLYAHMNKIKIQKKKKRKQVLEGTGPSMGLSGVCLEDRFLFVLFCFLAVLETSKVFIRGA